MRVIVFFLLFAPSPLWALCLFDEGGGNGVEYHATGTGNTTGHIVDIDIYNSTKKKIKLKLGPYLIPSADTTQGYVVPDAYEVLVPAGGEIKLELTGYCTNPVLPPVQPGGNLKPFSKWVTPDRSPVISPGIDIDTLEGFSKFMPLASDSVLFCYPGTRKPLLHVIDIDEYPVTAARMVIAMTREIIAAYDRLKDRGGIITPFSDNVLKEAWSIRQQTVWYAVSLLKGSNYGKESLRSSLIAQYEEVAGQKYETMSDAVREQLERGVNEFWDAVLKVGFEAKVMVRNT